MASQDPNEIYCGLFRKDQPLGPTETPKDATFDERRVLYSERNQVHEEAIRHEPVVVVGRRGSGKTAFLLGPASSEPGKREMVLMAAEEVFTNVRMLCDTYADHFGDCTEEDAARIWRVGFDHAFIGFVANTLNQVEVLSRDAEVAWDYITDITGNLTNDYDDCFQAFTNTLLDQIKRSPTRRAIRDHLRQFSSKGYEIALDSSKRLLERRGYRLYLVCDSLEGLHERLDQLQLPISSLLKYLGETTRERSPSFRVRCCYPSELAPKIQGFSKNPEKDYAYRLTISWHARELITMASARYARFLECHYPQVLSSHSIPSSFDPENTEHAKLLIRMLLGGDQLLNSFQNSNGEAEDPLAYVLRHTQLIPRHIIAVLNQVLMISVGNDSPFVDTSETLRTGVHKAEGLLIDGIFESYKSSHPQAKADCDRLLPQLSRTFTIDEFAAVVKPGKKHQSIVSKSHRLIRNLLSIGVLGEYREDKQIRPRYATADFAYTLQRDSDSALQTEMFCIHPLFSGKFGTKKNEEQARNLPVYPYGSDPDGPDYR